MMTIVNDIRSYISINVTRHEKIDLICTQNTSLCIMLHISSTAQDTH